MTHPIGPLGSRISCQPFLFITRDRAASHGGGGTPLFGLYGDVPLDRVWFFWPRCPKQGVQFDLALS